MKYFWLVLALVFSACSTEELSKEELLEGHWRIVEIDDNNVDTKEGVHFSPNNQYFSVDSQGKMIPRLIEKIWSINGDTLMMIDYNWEPKFIQEKGTFIYLIEELTSDKMILQQLNQFEQRVVYRKQ